LEAKPDVGHESLCFQAEKLVVGPLKATQIPTLIIIDALDECKDEEPASAILSILSRYMDQIPNVKFFITGRPEPRIRSGFRLQSLVPITEVLKLHEVQPKVVNHDIELFFQTQLTGLTENRSDCDSTEDWPSSSDIGVLCKKAAGFFIYASTVVKFIASGNGRPAAKLALVTSLPESTTKEGRFGVDQLYIGVLKQAFPNIPADDGQDSPYFQAVVGTILLIFNPLPIKSLSELLGHHPLDIRSTIRPLHSLLLIPDSTEEPILTFHKSFPDFLTDPERCKDKQFFVDPKVHHTEIFFLCLNLMKTRLKRNICNLDDYAILSEVEDLSTCRKDHIGEALEYACHFWTEHLLEIPSSGSHIEEVQQAIDKFFTTCLPYWIEVLALTGKLGVGVYALNDVEQWCASVSSAQIVYQVLYSHSLFRQVFCASGQMTASASFWKVLMLSTSLLPTYTIVVFHYPLPHPGFTNPMMQSCHKGLRLSGGSQLNGGPVPAQFHCPVSHGPLHAGTIPLQLVYSPMTSFSSMELQVPR
jgi:hypothetical protein